MRLTAKIKISAKERGWTLKAFHKKLESVYGEHAVSYFTLSRLGKDTATIRPKTIHQICAVLGVAKDILLSNTDENGSDAHDTEHEAHTRLCYSEGAYFEILTDSDDSLQYSRFILSPGIKTNLTQGKEGYIKRLYT